MQDNEYLTTARAPRQPVCQDLPDTALEALLLADDLTGALEAGALFASAGARAMVGIECAPDAPVAVIDLETRHLKPPAAALRAKKFAGKAGRFLFLKIDSTMRGPIAAQVKALSKRWPGRPVVFTPAYPALGRTVVNGRLFVDGVPLHETAFRRDPTHPARTTSIAEMLGDPDVRVLDAESEEDLARIAAAVCRSDSAAIAVGSGGLARHLAAMIPMTRREPKKMPRIGKPVVVCGSMHAASLAQIGHAGAWPVIECSKLSNGVDALAAISRSTHERIDSIDTLIIFGGDTARNLLGALGVRQIEPIGEALPGVPVSRIEARGRELTLITKAGGFGGADLLPQLAAALETNI